MYVFVEKDFLIPLFSRAMDGSGEIQTDISH